MNLPLHRKLEIAFWDIAIEFLSQSKSVRFIVKEFIQLKHSHHLNTYIGMVVVAGLFGFLLGFSLPLLAQVIR
jgi:hypothetical protein